MTKSIQEIQLEMETVILIKKALDVDGRKAFDLLKEWTSKKKEEMVEGRSIGSFVSTTKPISVNERASVNTFNQSNGNETCNLGETDELSHETESNSISTKELIELLNKELKKWGFSVL